MRLLRLVGAATALVGANADSQKGIEWQQTVPWPVYRATPKRYHATIPVLPACEKGVLGNFMAALGIESEPAGESALAQILGQKAADFLMNAPIEEMDVERFGNMGAYAAQDRIYHVLKALHMALQEDTNVKRLAAYVEAKQAKVCEKDGSCVIPAQHGSVELFEGENDEPTTPPRYPLNEVNDLLIGFSGSRALAMILSDVFGPGSSGILPKFIFPSPLVNLGQAACAAADASYLLDFDYQTTVCAIITLLASGASCASSHLTCPSPAGGAGLDWAQCVPYENKENPVSLVMATPFADAVLSDGTIKPEVLEKEKEIFAGCWSAIEHSYPYNTQVLCADSTFVNSHNDPAGVNKQNLPGWDIVLDLWMEQPGVPMLETSEISGMPMLVVSQRRADGQPLNGGNEAEIEHSCDLLLTIRGTSTEYEWMSNFNAGSEPLALVSANPEDDVRGHRGYLSFTSHMVQAFSVFLREKFFQKCDPNVSTITLTGHSLGGGVAQLLSAQVADLVADYDTKVQAITFAASHALNEGGMKFLRDRKVNIRSVMFELDPVPHLPCANNYGLPRCSERNHMGLEGIGEEPPYAQHPGIIPISKEELGGYSPDLMSLWNNPDFLSVEVSAGCVKGFVAMPSSLTIGQNHGDSYRCWIEKGMCGIEGGPRCSLKVPQKHEFSVCL